MHKLSFGALVLTQFYQPNCWTCQGNTLDGAFNSLLAMAGGKNIWNLQIYVMIILVGYVKGTILLNHQFIFLVNVLH